MCKFPQLSHGNSADALSLEWVSETGVAADSVGVAGGFVAAGAGAVHFADYNGQ
jgi:hypothetical protein